MTLYVNSTTEKIASNNIGISGNDIEFVLTGQYSKTDTVFPAVITIQNSRYTELEVTFPLDFKDEHKNGIYYYTIQSTIDSELVVFEKGLCKLITQPGGDNGAIYYDSGTITENRESDVYYRPNY